MINPFYPSDFLEVLKKLSYNWTEIIKYIEISTKDDWYYVPGENITWNLAPLYPTCQLLDLTNYFDFNSKKILSVYFSLAIWFSQVKDLVGQGQGQELDNNMSQFLKHM